MVYKLQKRSMERTGQPLGKVGLWYTSWSFATCFGVPSSRLENPAIAYFSAPNGFVFYPSSSLFQLCLLFLPPHPSQGLMQNSSRQLDSIKEFSLALSSADCSFVILWGFFLNKKRKENKAICHRFRRNGRCIYCWALWYTWKVLCKNQWQQQNRALMLIHVMFSLILQALLGRHW